MKWIEFSNESDKIRDMNVIFKYFYNNENTLFLEDNESKLCIKSIFYGLF